MCSKMFAADLQIIRMFLSSYNIDEKECSKPTLNGLHLPVTHNFLAIWCFEKELGYNRHEKIGEQFCKNFTFTTLSLTTH